MLKKKKKKTFSRAQTDIFKLIVCLDNCLKFNDGKFYTILNWQK